MDPKHKFIEGELIRWFGLTDPGRYRTHNEDVFLGQQFDAREIHHLGKVGEAFTGKHDFVFAVSDGIGGAKAGEFASRITVDKITHLLPRAFRQSAVGLEAGFADVLQELFDQIHRALVFVGDSYEECRGMEATLSMCWFTPGWMYFAHIGDSRLYYLPHEKGGIRQLSEDDTYVGWLYRNKKITEREAREHPRRKALQKALGADNQFIEPQLGAVAYEQGDIFLLCTDGLVEGLYDDEILSILRPEKLPGPGDNPAERLVKASLENSGRDNTTALVIEMR
ncbi:MAG: protein phosphatase 2C domain-containing protein [Methylacidiphilales bacterium]|nr:protein phosphatase 2C domain-containing protein [Candidatus Methylacidiphilales bacterium]